MYPTLLTVLGSVTCRKREVRWRRWGYDSRRPAGVGDCAGDAANTKAAGVLSATSPRRAGLRTVFLPVPEPAASPSPRFVDYQLEACTQPAAPQSPSAIL